MQFHQLHDLYESYDLKGPSSKLHHLNHLFHDSNKWRVLDNPRATYRIVRDEEDEIKLQRDLDTSQQWSVNWT